MFEIDRSLMVVTPKQPFLDWAQSVDYEENLTQSAALKRNEIESHQDTETFRARIRTRRAQLFKA